MGRTKRIRSRRNKHTKINLSCDTGTIEFVKWMSINGWTDVCKLRIAEFPNTCRGVLSLRKIKRNDLLMEIPLNLMITYKTLSESQLLNLYINNCTSKLSIHELLAIFIIIEHHKDESSEWFKYLSYLPLLENIYLPWFCMEEEILTLPEDLKRCVLDSKQNLLDSWEIIDKNLQFNILCSHCDKKINEIINKTSYDWAYTIVNTRAVYIDPTEIKKMSESSLEEILADEPTMALCPYIDMFNHSSSATVKAILKPDGNVPKYCLITENFFESYEEIFISYGAHSNQKLLCQYGFILPENQFDTIDFNLKEIIRICRVNANNRQYKFLCDHGINSDLSVSGVKFSFNMAAALYILSHPNELDWSMRVYISSFTKEQLKLMYSLAEILLKWKLKQSEEEYERITKKVKDPSRYFNVCLEYMQYRIDFIKRIIDVKKESML